MNDGDVGMTQLGEYLGFALEACQLIRVLCQCIGQHFDRNAAAEPGIAGTVYYLPRCQSNRSLVGRLYISGLDELEYLGGNLTAARTVLQTPTELLIASPNE